MVGTALAILNTIWIYIRYHLSLIHILDGYPVLDWSIHFAGTVLNFNGPVYELTITCLLYTSYTEWYRSRGYDFDITNSTQFDQKYIHGRDIFQSVSTIVDELFNDYIRR